MCRALSERIGKQAAAAAAAPTWLPRTTHPDDRCQCLLVLVGTSKYVQVVPIFGQITFVLYPVRCWMVVFSRHSRVLSICVQNDQLARLALAESRLPTQSQLIRILRSYDEPGNDGQVKMYAGTAHQLGVCSRYNLLVGEFSACTQACAEKLPILGIVALFTRS